MVNVTKVSMLTGKPHTLEIPLTEQELVAGLESGKLIQHAFPQLSADQREFLITGITPEEWAEQIGGGDDE